MPYGDATHFFKKWGASPYGKVPISRDLYALFINLEDDFFGEKRRKSLETPSGTSG